MRVRVRVSRERKGTPEGGSTASLFPSGRGEIIQEKERLFEGARDSNSESGPAPLVRPFAHSSLTLSSTHQHHTAKTRDTKHETRNTKRDVRLSDAYENGDAGHWECRSSLVCTVLCCAAKGTGTRTSDMELAHRVRPAVLLFFAVHCSGSFHGQFRCVGGAGFRGRGLATEHACVWATFITVPRSSQEMLPLRVDCNRTDIGRSMGIRKLQIQTHHRHRASELHGPRTRAWGIVE